MTQEVLILSKREVLVREAEVHCPGGEQTNDRREASEEMIDVIVTARSPRKQRAGALMLSSSCLDGSITRVGPG